MVVREEDRIDGRPSRERGRGGSGRQGWRRELRRPEVGCDARSNTLDDERGGEGTVRNGDRLAGRGAVQGDADLGQHPLGLAAVRGVVIDRPAAAEIEGRVHRQPREEEDLARRRVRAEPPAELGEGHAEEDREPDRSGIVIAWHPGVVGSRRRKPGVDRRPPECDHRVRAEGEKGGREEHARSGRSPA